MAKKIALVALFGLAVWVLLGCLQPEDYDVQGKGTVVFVKLEGGFYGIIGDNGEHYDPVNLPKEFQQDSLRVYFKADYAKSLVSFHMWGKLIEIKDIRKLEGK